MKSYQCVVGPTNLGSARYGSERPSRSGANVWLSTMKCDGEVMAGNATLLTTCDAP